jgi:hypothetical protein
MTGSGKRAREALVRSHAQWRAPEQPVQMPGFRCAVDLASLIDPVVQRALPLTKATQLDGG